MFAGNLDSGNLGRGCGFHRLHAQPAFEAAGAREHFDVMNVHTYGWTSPPDEPAAPDRLNYARVTLVHDVMVANGDSNVLLRGIVEKIFPVAGGNAWGPGPGPGLPGLADLCAEPPGLEMAPGAPGGDQRLYRGPAAGWINGSLGGAFYEIFWCLAVAFVAPRCRAALTAARIEDPVASPSSTRMTVRPASHRRIHTIATPPATPTCAYAAETARARTNAVAAIEAIFLMA